MMAFSSAFFAPNLADDASATSPAIQKESPNPQNSATMNGTSTTNMPYAEASQPASDPAAMDHDMIDDASVSTTSASLAASKKKKGTASTVKPTPKRARPGTSAAKKTKGGTSKKTKTATATKQADGTGPADAGNSSESDNGPYCLCRGPDDHRFMIACDRCEDWFHGECIGMDKHTGENLVQRYICPNCTEGGRYTTRYKKMCSLPGCINPSRIYDAVRPSIFCSSDHCQAWWEQLIATLPRSKDGAPPEVSDWLTQEEFIGLLDAPTKPAPAADSESDPPPTAPWHLGQKPFATPPNFWDSPASARALTAEEQELITTSAAARSQLGEEIILCKKMLQLIDMAVKQRDAAIAAGKGTAKDLCGYDTRLDTVGATHQFARFLTSPQGEAIFRAGRLDGPQEESAATNGINGTNGDAHHPENSNHTETTGAPTTNGTDSAGPPDLGEDRDDTFPYMCTKKKCKPHNGWIAILTKAVKHDMKELAAQAKEMLDAEQRVRDGAAGRFRRRLKEGNEVIVLRPE